MIYFIMGDFALIIPKSEEYPSSWWGKILWKIKNISDAFLTKEEFYRSVEKVELYENFNTYIIRIPYRNKKMLYKRSKVEKFLNNFRMEKEIGSFIIPISLKETVNCECCFYDAFKGKLLFKALLWDIIDGICVSRGLQSSNLDICIVNSKDNEELYGIIDLICDKVKYVTVLTKDKKTAEEVVKMVYDSSGLAVGITENSTSAFKNADLIINLGDLKQYKNKARISRKVIVLNYGQIDVKCLSEGTKVVNGIDVVLPQIVAVKFDKEIYKYFRATELAEIILYNFIEEKKVLDRRFMYNLNYVSGKELKRISHVFKKEGYVIEKLIEIK